MNLVLITIDSLRSDYISFNGNTWIRTPNLDAFARDGIYFSQAYPEALPTIPVRRTLYTGRRCFPFSDWDPASKPQTPGWTPIPKGQKTLAEMLFENGYQTALVTDVFHTFRPDMNFHRGFEEWHWIRGQECDRYHTGSTLFQTNWDQHITPQMDLKSRKIKDLQMYLKNTSYRESEEEYLSPQVFRQATKWVEQNYDTEKFFLCIDCFDPHEPWDPPRYYRDMYNPGYTGTEIYCPDYSVDYKTIMSEDELNHIKALYAGEVTMVDYWIGSFLSKLRQLELDKNTMVVILSDHGFQLGDNGYIGKYISGLFPCLMNLYMAIQHPDHVGNGIKLNGMVYNLDIYPTICEALKIEVPEWNEGRSLWPLIEKKEDKFRDYVTSIYKNYGWIRTHDYTFFCQLDQTDPHLYDNHSDPSQSRNLSSEMPELCKKMWNIMQEDGGGEIPFYNVVPRSNDLHP